MKNIIFITLFLTSILNAQNNRENKIIVLESALNTILNDSSMNCIFKNEKICFIENELLLREFNLKLFRKKKQVEIVCKEKLNKKGKHLILGDFTTDFNDPTNIRVQIEILEDDVLLNFGLKKRDGKYEFDLYTVIGNN